MAREADCFKVAVMPLGNIGKAAAALFQNTTTALQCHASMASGLRDAGWKLVGYTN